MIFRRSRNFDDSSETSLISTQKLQHSETEKRPNHAKLLILSSTFVATLVVTVFVQFSSFSAFHNEQQQLLESRHPLSGQQQLRSRRQRRVLLSSENLRGLQSSTTHRQATLASSSSTTTQRGLRLLSFGSSSTWGSGLPTTGDNNLNDDEVTSTTDIINDVQQQLSLPYPNQLDDEAYNAAIPHSAADAALFAAACTQSIVGNSDTDYNVITVEFSGDDFTDSHAILVRRLRQRFPFATIVLVQIPDPLSQFTLATGDNRIAISMKEWLEAEDPLRKDSFDDIDYYDDDHKRLASAMKTAAGRWFKMKKPKNDSQYLLKSIVSSDDSIILYSIPTPNLHYLLEDELSSFLQLFDIASGDTVLSSAGHQHVAHDLRHLLIPLVDTAESRLRKPDLLGTWGSGDECHLWYDTGRYDLESTASQTNLAASDTLHKHALEFTSGKLRQTITVHNPFSTDRMLYLTYLTDDDNTYPRTRVLLDGVPSVMMEPFRYNTVDDRDEESGRKTTTQHYARTSAVGYLKPGVDTVVTLDVVQPNAPLPFRLLGASLLAEEVADGVNLDVEFALERDSVPASNLSEDSTMASMFWEGIQ